MTHPYTCPAAKLSNSAMMFELYWPRLGLGSAPQLGASGWWRSWIEEREKYPEALTWAGPAHRFTPPPGFGSINHYTVAMLPVAHTHTQFSHGLKLERVENCGRSSILLPHTHGRWVPRKVSTLSFPPLPTIDSFSYPSFLSSIVSDQSEGCEDSKLHCGCSTPIRPRYLQWLKAKISWHIDPNVGHKQQIKLSAMHYSRLFSQQQCWLQYLESERDLPGHHWPPMCPMFNREPLCELAPF